MNLKIDFDDVEFRETMQVAARKLGANVPELLKEETRLFIGEFRKRVPPMASFGGRVSSKDKKIGTKAIQTDMSNLAFGLDHKSTQLSPRLAELVRKNDEAGIQAYLNNLQKSSLKLRRFVSAKELELAHIKNRNRNGRIPKDLGLAVRTIDRNRYMRQLIKNLGHNKGAFNAASFATGDKVPAWIKKAGALGTFMLTGQREKAEITVTGKSNVPRAQVNAVNQSLAVRRKKFVAEMKRILSTFARTGKIVSRRRSLNT